MKHACAKISCKGCPQMLVEIATLMALFGLTVSAKLMPLIAD